MRSIIELEGIDGSGKTTGFNYLHGLFRAKGRRVLATREVGSPVVPYCQEARRVVLNPDYNLDGRTMELIFASMRIENLRAYKHLGDEYDIILSDRGWLSHLAYSEQNAGEEFTESFYLNTFASNTYLPDVIIYFDCDVDIAQERIQKRGDDLDAIELKGVDYQRRIANSFNKFIGHYEDNISIFRVDANQSRRDVQEQLAKIATQID